MRILLSVCLCGKVGGRRRGGKDGRREGIKKKKQGEVHISDF